MIDPTPTELEAVRLRWHALHPEATADDSPSADEATVLLQEIRERAIAIENASLEMLKEKMRVRSKPANVKKPRQWLVIVIVVLIIMLFLYGMGGSLFGR